MTLIAPLNVPQPVKLRIEDYELLLRAGTFAHLAKTELIDGVIVEMDAQYRRHSFAKNELTYRLRRALEALGSPIRRRARRRWRCRLMVRPSLMSC